MHSKQHDATANGEWCVFLVYLAPRSREPFNCAAVGIGHGVNSGLSAPREAFLLYFFPRSHRIWTALPSTFRVHSQRLMSIKQVLRVDTAAVGSKTLPSHPTPHPVDHSARKQWNWYHDDGWVHNWVRIKHQTMLLFSAVKRVAIFFVGVGSCCTQSSSTSEIRPDILEGSF